MPAKGAGRQARHQDAVRALHPGVFTVTQGRYQSKTAHCFKCGYAHVVREEKETDVNIAVSIVAYAARANMNAALIVSADSDLAPAVRMAQELNPGTFITAAFPPKRYSNELKALMPASFQIGRSKIHQAQLDSRFTAGGSTWTRPSKWQ